MEATTVRFFVGDFVSQLLDGSLLAGLTIRDAQRYPRQ